MSTLHGHPSRREGTTRFSRVAWHCAVAGVAIAGCAATDTDPDPPVVTLTVSPEQAVVGHTVAFTWSSTDAVSCTASSPTGGSTGWTGSVPVEGSTDVALVAAGAHRFRLECVGPGGSGAEEATLAVDPPGEANFTADRVDGFVGDVVKLDWQVPWAAACTASGDWQGERAPEGTAEAAIPHAGTVRFGLRCHRDARDTLMERVVTGVEPLLAISTAFPSRPRTISTSEGAPYGDADFWTGAFGNTWHQYGPTKVMRLYICLTGEVPVAQCGDQPRPDGPLSDAMLQRIEQRLAAYGSEGVRLLVRFVYNYGPIGAPDAPLEITLGHIDQLLPILLRQRDRIFALQAGFIGTWGEWHNSTYGNDSELARNQVLHLLDSQTHDAFPILVRYPVALLGYTGTTEPDPSLGLHNDFFASDENDGGTWIPGPGQTVAGLRAYAQDVAVASMFTAEFGALDPARQQCDVLEAEMRRFRLQSLSLFIWPHEVGDAIDAQGCLQHLLDRVGVRLELERVEITGAARAGAEVSLELTVRNDGFGRVLRARPARIQVLQGGAVVGEMPVPLDLLDLRRAHPEAPGSATVYTVPITLPSTLATGEVTLALVIDDPAPSLRGDPAYALPFNSRDEAGTDLFDPGTGRNLLARFTVLGN